MIFSENYLWFWVTGICTYCTYVKCNQIILYTNGCCNTIYYILYIYFIHVPYSLHFRGESAWVQPKCIDIARNYLISDFIPHQESTK